MLQNIKVDVIYYKTNTDFEMEFNLCGCCRMRLLTDKSPDPKTLVHSMARAVSRSSVIIVIGSLFGDDGIMSLTAGALKMQPSRVNNKTYGINGTDEIKILSGATPLVTPEGYFGGCIIESGPQTMVLLSDSKNIRKTIMQNLIHPYIEELAAAQLSHSNTPAAEPPIEEIGVLQTAEEIITAEEIAQDAEIELIEDEEIASDSNEVADSELNEPADIADNTSDVELSGNMVFELENETLTAEDNIDSSTDETTDISSSTPEFSAAFEAAEKEKNNYFFNFSDYDEDTEEELDEEPHKKPISLNIPILIIAILLLLTLAVLSCCIFYIPSREGVATTTYLRDIFTSLFG